MGRKPVHLDIHLKGLEQLRIFQLGRRRAEVGLTVVYDHNKDLVVVAISFWNFSRSPSDIHPHRI